MEQQMTVTYYTHSGFSCALGNILCIFDYWTGEHNELPENIRLTPSQLVIYDEVYVFISHAHPDHFDRTVYEWYPEVPITYIISYDMPMGVRGKRMAPGDTLKLGEKVTVQAFPSTDLGVSFLVHMDGIPVFHAGDLNFWHWREESTSQEIAEAETEFKDSVKPIIGHPIELCFFPVDPRQGRLYEAGANYFLMACKPKLLIPMHFWGRNELITEYVRRASTASSSIYAMTRSGERIQLTFQDKQLKYLDVFNDKPITTPEDPNNPFFGTDLPVSLS